MIKSTANEFRRLLPVWGVMLVLPIPALACWSIGSARYFALGYLFIGCAIVAGECFKRDPAGRFEHAQNDVSRLWWAKMVALILAMLLAVAFFTAICESLNHEPGLPLILPILSLLAIVPALCIVPYFTLKTGKPYEGVILAGFVLGVSKIAGDIAALLVYGPEAGRLGYLSATWSHPNLLSLVFIVGTAISSVVFYTLGQRSFRQFYRMA